MKKDWYDINAPRLWFYNNNVGHQECFRSTQTSTFGGLINFWGMNFTMDKLRSLVRKWQTLMEAHVDVKTTDNYTLRMFCIGFSKRRQNWVEDLLRTSQIRRIRCKMREIMVAWATTSDLNDFVRRLMAESIGRDIEKETQSIFPLQNVKMLKVPKFDTDKMMYIHGYEDLGVKVERPDHKEETALE
ncbi:hypothetical protein DVH24_007381 [Malus domestica]|uniref:40S ribosomal protein S3a n=1 Tax=Malus domestica TaxID=3750 RepID=A0A498HKT1_MALDO|nr:hypothetical protein DVH24_007381 [Malus domestica]